MADRRQSELGLPPEQSLPVVRSYEVHVEGRLGNALLHYLHWSNRTQPEESVVRVQVSPRDLHQFLASCADCGLTIDRITRLDSDPARSDPIVNRRA
jgi:hypothetical protein